MCRKPAPDGARLCPRCGTDLTLLVDYLANLHEGLARAEALTRSGELGQAVWAYLEVLEVDPENPTARRQVGQVATAVRQFDRVGPRRRWLERLRRRTRFRRRDASWRLAHEQIGWFSMVVVLLLLAACFVLGYHLGYRAARQESPPAAGAAGF
jgi:hypothetical protein